MARSAPVAEEGETGIVGLGAVQLRERQVVMPDVCLRDRGGMVPLNVPALSFQITERRGRGTPGLIVLGHAPCEFTRLI